MKILLDPGHGGDAPGAVYGGVEEEDITLAVCLRTSNTLRTLGHDVFLTRDRDIGVPLVERVRLMNEFKCDAFVSVHCNASTNEGVHGLETYYRDDNDLRLATSVHKTLSAYTGRKVIGLYQDISRLKKRLAVLNNNTIPCTLVEVGYLSNNEDRGYIVENITTIADVLAHGIDRYACERENREKKLWPEMG